MTRRNDLPFVRDVMDRLDRGGIRTWLFGGWAEEMLGLTSARAHHDVDLLYPAADFTSVDAFIARNSDLAEIVEKRFGHKRAFLNEGVMIELMLVQHADGRLITLYRGTATHIWPADLLVQRARGIRVASAAALLSYREAHGSLTAG
jgi:hypothetical protein